MVRAPGETLGTLILALCLMSTYAHADWSEPATRTGVTLPDKGSLAVTAATSGIYVKNVDNLGVGSAGITGSSLIWNYALAEKIGIFGGHDLYGMWWDDISFLAFGHAVGFRFLTGPYLAFETAYLTHRIEYQWIEGNPYSMGGLHDHGGEMSAILHFEIARRLRLEGTFLGRFFAEPKNENSSNYTNQTVFGFGLRSIFKITKSHELEANLRVLRIYRGPDPRQGVDAITWNTLGRILWRFQAWDRLGFLLGVEASSSFWCGEIPMLEIKRSMIDEPMALASLGLYFSI